MGIVERSARAMKAARHAFKHDRLFHAVDVRKQEGWLKKMLADYSGLQQALRDHLGCIPPPVDPYKLLALASASGYHEQAMRWRKTAVLSQGWEASERLTNQIKYANERQTFSQFLDEWIDDAEYFGNAFTHLIRGPVTVNFYRKPAVKMRVRPPKEKDSKPLDFILYEYAIGSGIAAYRTFDAFSDDVVEGIDHFRHFSRSGNAFYGEPDYQAALKLLELNVSIVDLANVYFDNSMITDMAIVMRGGELDPQEKQEVKDYLTMNMKGISNAFKVLFFEVGPNENVDFHKLSTQFNEGLFIKLRESIREEITASDGTPPRFANIMGNTQLGGSGEGNAQLRMLKIGWGDRRQQTYEEHWQRVFDMAGLPDPESFKFKRMDTTAGETDAQYYATLVGAGIKTPEEAAAEIDSEKRMQELAAHLNKIADEIEGGEHGIS